MTDWKNQLKALHPCPEAYRWACQYTTLRQAWRACERRDWMAWLVRMSGGNDHDLYAAIDIGYDKGCPSEEELLQDAYIILDFMPNPPVLL